MKKILSLFTAILLPVYLAQPIFSLKEKSRNSNYNLGAKLAYRIRQKMGGYYIGEGALFYGVPFFPHGYQGIFISGEAVIGDGCVIFQQVTIGSDTLIDSKKFGAPTIGKNCYIGAGAKIIGNIHVGDNCRIGANAVVYKDVPNNSTVVMGGGMTVIPHASAPDNRFINRKGEELQYWNGSKFEILHPRENPRNLSTNKRKIE